MPPLFQLQTSSIPTGHWGCKEKPSSPLQLQLRQSFTLTEEGGGGIKASAYIQILKYSIFVGFKYIEK